MGGGGGGGGEEKRRRKHLIWLGRCTPQPDPVLLPLLPLFLCDRLIEIVKSHGVIYVIAEIASRSSCSSHPPTPSAFSSALDFLSKERRKKKERKKIYKKLEKEILEKRKKEKMEEKRKRKKERQVYLQ